jgi:tetratricopeptide (TPR) repeat protein
MTASNDPTRTIPSVTPTEPSSTETQIQHGAPTPLLQPAGVPGFVVYREIARGGMGLVYAAHDPAFDREVAVKVMHPGQDAVRFVVESKITAQLPHPGVPPVYALGALPDGRPFLAMKLIGGRTLADELRAAGGADLPRLLGAFEQICQTVGFAHSRGIIHRDLKPSNVMIGSFGEVLVMDWGLAKRVDAAAGAGSEAAPPGAPPRSAAETVAGQVKGTPAYMAPEQARGEPVDARADVFALGGILATVLTGEPPFRGETVMGTVLKAAMAEVQECFVALDRCAADAELIALAKRCLAASAAARYANGRDVAAAVSAYRAGVEERLRRAERDRAAAEARAEEEVNTRREAEARAAEQRNKRRVQLALAAAVGLLLAGAGGFAWYSDRQAGAQKLKEERAESDRRADLQRADAGRKESEAKLKGEADAERRFKSEQARQGVRANSGLAADLRKQYKFKAADAALAQAAELAKGAPELLPEVERARRDLAFVVRLDDIRYRKWALIAEPGGKGHFDTKSAAPEYRKAFAERGLDLIALAPAGAAERIAASAVKGDLIAAVDDWALHEPDAATRDRLLEIARAADPGDWTDRLRDPGTWKQKAAVAQLAADADPATVPPAALSVLWELMRRNGLNPAPLLAAARAKHPSDFELAFALGLWHTHGGDGPEVGAFEAARALRPENVAVWGNLGDALVRRGDYNGAVAAYQKITELDPRLPAAHFHLGIALKDKGDVDGAIAAYKRAIELDPRHARAHNNLGAALKEKGDVEGAVGAYKRAIELDPKFAQAHNNLGIVYLNRKQYPEAIACARAAIKANPTYSNAHAMLGEVLLRTGDVAGARASLTEAVRLDTRWEKLLAKLPPLPVAPRPREIKR